MPNRPLRVCPSCGGGGSPSYVRSGAWLNAHCPGANGPLDTDDYPDGHEVDCAATGRWARVEYKRPRETMLGGQAKHLEVLHRAWRPEWTLLLLVVEDDGQSSDGAPVSFRWRTSRQPWRDPAMWSVHRTTLSALGKSVAAWVWRAGPSPAFLVPLPPACAACSVPLPEHPQQTMPVGGTNAYVCAACFRTQFGLRVQAV